VIVIVIVDGNVIVAVHVNGNDTVIVISPNVDDGHRRLAWSPDPFSDRSE
jgi:hypothetical protein